MFPADNVVLAMQSITRLYGRLWRVQLHFMRIRQSLQLREDHDASTQAVATQSWIAVSTRVLAAIVKTRLEIHASLYETLQTLSLAMVEQAP